MAVKITSYRSRVFQLLVLLGDGSVDPESESGDSVSGAELETFYRSIPVSGDDTDALEYTWVIEDYVHTIPSSITPP